MSQGIEVSSMNSYCCWWKTHISPLFPLLRTLSVGVWTDEPHLLNTATYSPGQGWTYTNSVLIFWILFS